ncbi:FAD-binding oxidoreductase [Nonomuraea sp. ZG12]|uniref:FAD-binding oxidoreductase n=1 Tax=Nonomuraea sp. ZG12 TaxID=3452207 RepID=UPI003F89CEAB
MGPRRLAHAQAGAADGQTWRPWRVVERREETADVMSLVLAPVGDEPVPPALPGQYVSVRVRMPDGVRQLRQYTLSGYGETGLRRITVKRMRGEGAPEGEVSNLLHATVKEGDELILSAPFGDVTLTGGEAPLVLASAGIGCTPITAMLHHLADTGSTRRVLLLHADRSEPDHALRHDMESLTAALPNSEKIFWYEDGERGRAGRIDLAGVEVPAGAVAYLCGPLPFMREARAQLIEGEWRRGTSTTRCSVPTCGSRAPDRYAVHCGGLRT